MTKPYEPPSLRAYPPNAGSVCLAFDRFIVRNCHALTRDMACFVGHLLDAELRSFVDVGLLRFKATNYGGPETETFVELTEAGAACAALEKERKTS